MGPSEWLCSLLLYIKQVQCMLKTSRKALSLQLLSKHQEQIISEYRRIKGMITKIQNYRPKFNLNTMYGKSRLEKIEKRMEEREKQSDRLFEENMKLIYRIESTGPKIETKKFPVVRPNPKRLKSLSNCSQSSSKQKFRIKDVFRNEQQLFQENIKLITDIESTGPKIKCWLPKKMRQLNELVLSRKKEEEEKIIDKFKEISKEFTRLNRMRSFKSRSSSGSIRSKSRSALQ